MASSNPFLPLVWITEQLPSQKLYLADSPCPFEQNQKELAEVVEAGAIKAIDLLDHNIRDNSMYLLFEWFPQETTLQIALTDASKTQDAPELVKLQLSQVDASEDLREAIKFWLHDFLCSYPGFLRFSLVAAFHSSNRRETELL